jgi:hypothetical protein
VAPSWAVVTDDTLEENAGTVVVVDVGTGVVEVVEGCAVVDERTVWGLLMQLVKRTARTREKRLSATCLRTAAFFRKGSG